MRSACLAALLLYAAPSFAERGDFAVEYFDVHGATSRELDAEIGAKGPVGENGLREGSCTKKVVPITRAAPPGSPPATYAPRAQR